MNAISKLLSFYDNAPLNDAYRNIAQNMLKHLDRIPTASSYEMAELCYTAPSTLRRLATKIGYGSYSDFRTEIKWSIENYWFLNSYRFLGENTVQAPANLFDALAKMVQQTAESMDDAQLTTIVADLRSHKKIAFFVDEVTQQVKRLQADLIMDGHEVSLYSELHDQVSACKQLSDSTFAVFIKPEFPQSKNVINLLSTISGKNIDTLVITNNSSEIIRNQSKHVLSVSGTSSILDSFMIEMIISALVSKHQELYIKNQVK